MKPAHDYLQNQNCQAPLGVPSRRFVQKVDQEKAHGEGAADDWNPLGLAKETVRGVIGPGGRRPALFAAGGSRDS
jgi:hypothetical protein